MSYEAVTYINNVSSEEVPRFIELNKKFTDMGVGKNRKATGEWLFRHWYGSGHTFVMFDQYNSMEDYHSDSEIFLQNVKNKIEATKDKTEKEALKKYCIEYRAFSNGHTDEVRGVYAKT